jgi:hypothetical protein
MWNNLSGLEQWQACCNTILNFGLGTKQEIEINSSGFINFSWQVEDFAVLPNL